MKLKYTPLWTTSSDDDLESPRRGSIHLQHQLQAVRKTKLLTNIFALLAVAAFLGNVSIFLKANRGEIKLQDGLYPLVVPAMPVETVVFEEDETYSAASSNESDKAWDNILPPGRGYIFAPTQRSSLLETGEITKHGELYSVAVFHQLHCLGMIRNVYWTLISKSIDNSADLIDYAQGRLHNSHTNHCFDYLRQTLMCGGDLSLEWPKTEEDGSRFLVDGWNVPHMCKSWDSIMDFMDENHFNASTRTDILGE